MKNEKNDRNGQNTNRNNQNQNQNNDRSSEQDCNRSPRRRDDQ